MLDPTSRAYDPSYHPPVSLEKLAAANPGDQLLAEHLSQTHAALKEQAAADGNLSPSIAAQGPRSRVTSSLADSGSPASSPPQG